MVSIDWVRYSSGTEIMLDNGLHWLGEIFLRYRDYVGQWFSLTGWDIPQVQRLCWAMVSIDWVRYSSGTEIMLGNGLHWLGEVFLRYRDYVGQWSPLTGWDIPQVQRLCWAMVSIDWVRYSSGTEIMLGNGLHWLGEIFLRYRDYVGQWFSLTGWDIPQVQRLCWTMVFIDWVRYSSGSEIMLDNGLHWLGEIFLRCRDYVGQWSLDWVRYSSGTEIMLGNGLHWLGEIFLRYRDYVGQWSPLTGWGIPQVQRLCWAMVHWLGEIFLRYRDYVGQWSPLTGWGIPQVQRLCRTMVSIDWVRYSSGTEIMLGNGLHWLGEIFLRYRDYVGQWSSLTGWDIPQVQRLCWAMVSIDWVRYSSGTEIMLDNGLHWLGEIFLRFRDYVGQWSPLTGWDIPQVQRLCRTMVSIDWVRYSSGTEIMLDNGFHWLGEIFLRYRDYVGQWSPLTGWDIPQVQRLCWTMVFIDWVRYSSGTEIMLDNGLHWLGEIFLRYRDYVGQWSPLTGWDIPQVQRLCWAMVSIDWVRYSSGSEIMLDNGLHWLGEIFLRYRDYVGQWSPLTGWDIPQVQRLCWTMVSIDWVRYSSGTEIMLDNGLHWLGEIFLRFRDYVGQWSPLTGWDIPQVQRLCWTMVHWLGEIFLRFRDYVGQWSPLTGWDIPQETCWHMVSIDWVRYSSGTEIMLDNGFHWLVRYSSGTEIMLDNGLHWLGEIFLRYQRLCWTMVSIDWVRYSSGSEIMLDNGFIPSLTGWDIPDWVRYSSGTEIMLGEIFNGLHWLGEVFLRYRDYVGQWFSLTGYSSGTEIMLDNGLLTGWDIPQVQRLCWVTMVSIDWVRYSSGTEIMLGNGLHWLGIPQVQRLCWAMVSIDWGTEIMLGNGLHWLGEVFLRYRDYVGQWSPLTGWDIPQVQRLCWVTMVFIDWVRYSSGSEIMLDNGLHWLGVRYSSGTEIMLDNGLHWLGEIFLRYRDYVGQWSPLTGWDIPQVQRLCWTMVFIDWVRYSPLTGEIFLSEIFLRYRDYVGQWSSLTGWDWLGEIFLRYRDYVGQWYSSGTLTGWDIPQVFRDYVGQWSPLTGYSSGTEIMLDNGLHWLGEIFLRYRDYVGQWFSIDSEIFLRQRLCWTMVFIDWVRYSSGTEIMLDNGLWALTGWDIPQVQRLCWTMVSIDWVRYSSWSSLTGWDRFRDYVGQWSPLTGWDIPQVQRLCWTMVFIDWVRYSSGTEIMLDNGLHWLGEIFLRYRDYVGQWSPLTGWDIPQVQRLCWTMVFIDWVRYSSGSEIMLDNGLHWLGEVFLRYRDYVGQWFSLTGWDIPQVQRLCWTMVSIDWVRYSSGTEIMLGNGLHWLGEVFLRYRDYVGQWSPLTGWGIPQVQRLCWAMVSIDWVRYSSGTEIMLGNGLHWLGEIFLRYRDYVGQWSPLTGWDIPQVQRLCWAMVFIDWVRYSSGTEIMLDNGLHWLGEIFLRYRDYVGQWSPVTTELISIYTSKYINLYNTVLLESKG